MHGGPYVQHHHDQSARGEDARQGIIIARLERAERHMADQRGIGRVDQEVDAFPNRRRQELEPKVVAGGGQDQQTDQGEDAEDVTDAYERLIMDVIRGNQTLFMRGDEVEAAWAWTDPLIEGWEARNDVPKVYDAGSAGPEDAMMLMHRDGRKWREIKG